MVPTPGSYICEGFDCEQALQGHFEYSKYRRAHAGYRTLQLISLAEIRWHKGELAT
jgi:hypothetical protein